MNETIRVLLVDDHELIRHGLKRILEEASNFKIVAEASNGNEALALIQTLLPDVVVADHNMPFMTGIELLKAIRHLGLKVKVILLTVDNAAETLENSLNEGVDAFILKESAGQEIVKAIQLVTSGVDKRYIDPTLMPLLLKTYKSSRQAQSPLEQLTDREKQILALVVTGKSNREIAQQLFLAEKTVKNHLTVLFRKLDVKDRVNAILYAVDHHFQYRP